MEIIWSECLKMACETKSIDEVIKEALKDIDASEYANTGYAEYWYSTSINKWNQHGKNRIYINMRYGRRYNGKSKWQRGVTACIDLDSKKVFDSSRSYNNSDQRSFIIGLAEDMAKEIF